MSTPHAETVEPGPRLRAIGRYQLLGILGRGSMGAAYRAWDPLLERTVALKVMAPCAEAELAQRFVGEARAAAGLHHPNVVAVYDLGHDADGAPYLVMELLRGRDLQKALHDGPPLDLRARVAIVEQVLEGLAAAHRAGIVHRDIKPANVFLCDDGPAKIMDFGVARLSAAGATAAGVVVGTAGYMAPEQASGEAVDARSDLFAVGCVLYEMLAGRRAFRGDSLMDVFYAVTHLDPDYDLLPAGAAHTALLPTLRRALARDRTARFQRAEEFADELARWRRAFAGPAAPRPERRQQPRTQAAVPVCVQGWQDAAGAWTETCLTADLSAQGGSICLARAVQPGQVLKLALPLPRELRRYDLDAPQYVVWALVRAAAPGNAHVLFLGREAPDGFEEAPAARFELPSERLTATRRHVRFQLVVDVRLRKIEDGGAFATEWTVTEDLGAGGARLRTSLPVRRGEVLELEEVAGPFHARCAVLDVSPGEPGVYQRIRVAFLDDTAEEDVRELLARQGIRVVRTDAGPRDAVLLVTADTARGASLGAMLAHLRDPAYDVTCVGSLVEAAERLRARAFHVVVAELDLPDGRGLPVLERLAEFAPRVAALGVLDHRDDAAMIEALRRGFDGVVEYDALDAALLAHLLAAARRRVENDARSAPLHVAAGPLSELPEGGLPEILRRLYLGRRTGLLTLAAGDDRRHLRFRQGHVVGAGSSVKEERLGQRLVANGRLSADQLARASAVVISSGRKLGAVLIDLGVLDAPGLEQAVALHTRSVVERLFEVEHAGWAFRDEEVPLAEDVTLAVSTAEIVLDSVRRMRDGESLRRALGSRRRRLRPVSDPLLRYQRVRLDPIEGFVLSRIDGTLDIDGIAATVPIAPEKTDRIVLALLSAGLVEEASPADGAAAARPPTDPAARPTEPLTRQQILNVWRELPRQDHFQVLGVPRGAAPAAITSAFARLARRFHPDCQHDPALGDLHRQINDIFARIADAARVLRDPAARAAYEKEAPASANAPAAVETSGAPNPAYLVEEAGRLLGAGRPFDAIRTLEGVLPLCRGHLHRHARVLLARAYARNPRWVHDAETLAVEVLREEPGCADALLVLGEIYEQARLPERAAAAYRRVVSMAGDDPEARAGLLRLGAHAHAHA